MKTIKGIKVPKFKIAKTVKISSPKVGIIKQKPYKLKSSTFKTKKK